MAAIDPTKSVAPGTPDLRHVADDAVSVRHEHLSDLMFRVFRAEGLLKIALRVIDNEHAGEPLWCELEHTLESASEILLKVADEISSQYLFPSSASAEERAS